ncbi:MAG TPA: chorismate lyase [Gammaproteobacteria bacterium]
MKLHWQPIYRFNHSTLAGKLRRLLADHGSLTHHLNRYCPEKVGISIKNQSWQTPLVEERKSLMLPDRTNAFVREVFLTCQEQRWVYGRSILPAMTVSGSERRLLNWGNKSLGDYLFTTGHCRRGPIEVTQIPSGNALHQMCGLRKNISSPLWGRRSIFYIRNKPLLVIEILLPALYKSIA